MDLFSDSSLDQAEQVSGVIKQESPASVASRDDDVSSGIDDATEDEDVRASCSTLEAS
jgi:hypothetical protein